MKRMISYSVAVINKITGKREMKSVRATSRTSARNKINKNKYVVKYASSNE
jgi:hypothetical protein